MNKSNNKLEDCLNDLYQLGKIRGNYNTNWTDEYGRLELSKNYYNKTKAIADQYNINYAALIDDYRENNDEEAYCLWDKLTLDMQDILKKQIQNIINKKPVHNNHYFD